MRHQLTVFAPQRKTAIPVEVLDCIVVYMLGRDRSFRRIANFSLVSSRFRALAFRRYFEIFEVRSPKHWDNACRIADVSGWVR